MKKIDLFQFSIDERINEEGSQKWKQHVHTETVGFEVGLSVGDLVVISVAE